VLYDACTGDAEGETGRDIEELFPQLGKSPVPVMHEDELASLTHEVTQKLVKILTVDDTSIYYMTTS